jgi:hypothetical protein
MEDISEKPIKFQGATDALDRMNHGRGVRASEHTAADTPLIMSH